MKEVKDLEGEDGLWLNQHGSEQSPPDQLLMALGGIFWSIHTVSNNNLMDAAEIENSELVMPGWVWTDFAGLVTKLHHFLFSWFFLFFFWLFLVFWLHLFCWPF